jgi:hypothetical protein
MMMMIAFIRNLLCCYNNDKTLNNASSKVATGPLTSFYKNKRNLYT